MHPFFIYFTFFLFYFFNFCHFLNCFLHYWSDLNFGIFHTIWVEFVMGLTLGIKQYKMFLKWLISCPSSAPTLLLSSSSFSPALAVLLPCSFQVPFGLIPSFSPFPAQLLPFSWSLLFSDMLSRCSSPAPGPAHPSLAAFIIISTLQLFFGMARADFYSKIFFFFSTGHGKSLS